MLHLVLFFQVIRSSRYRILGSGALPSKMLDLGLLKKKFEGNLFLFLAPSGSSKPVWQHFTRKYTRSGVENGRLSSTLPIYLSQNENPSFYA